MEGLDSIHLVNVFSYQISVIGSIAIIKKYKKNIIIIEFNSTTISNSKAELEVFIKKLCST